METPKSLHQLYSFTSLMLSHVPPWKCLISYGRSYPTHQLAYWLDGLSIQGEDAILRGSEGRMRLGRWDRALWRDCCFRWYFTAEFSRATGCTPAWAEAGQHRVSGTYVRVRIASEDGSWAETYCLILCVHCVQKLTEWLLFAADLHLIGLSPAPREHSPPPFPLLSKSMFWIGLMYCHLWALVFSPERAWCSETDSSTY